MPSFTSHLLVQALRDLKSALLSEQPLVTRRRQFENIAAKGIRVPRGVRIHRINISGLEAAWIEPEQVDKSRIIYYLHGGGYVIGSINTHRNLAARIAQSSRARLLIINYRLAPEHPFPAALEDALLGYRWLLSQGTNPSHLSIGGDSAGGGLTLSCAVSLRDNGEPLPGALFLLSPWTDLTFSGESIQLRAHRDPVLQLSNGWLENVYAANHSAVHPLISPLFAELHNLPPILIQVGSEEILFDDSARLADKLNSVGVINQLEIWDGMWHVFQAFSPLVPEATKAIIKIGYFLTRYT